MKKILFLLATTLLPSVATQAQANPFDGTWTVTIVCHEHTDAEFFSFLKVGGARRPSSL